MKLSIVIPIYNERSTIGQVLQRIQSVGVSGLEKEIILVDDCSTDGTREFLKSLNPVDYKIIFQPVNAGKGAALHAGFAQSAGDIVIIQDADLEYDPDEIIKVIQPILDGKAKVVYGSRYLSPDLGLSFWHSFFNKLFTKFGNFLIGQKLTDIMTCYKAFDRMAMKGILTNLQSKRFGFEPEVTAKISKADIQILEVPISYHPRNKNQGKHMNFKGQLESLWALLKFSKLW